MKFSPQQDAAMKAVAGWLKNPGKQQVFRLFGYAGTGKTTLAKEFAAGVRGEVLFGAFTGKAAHVLHRKGCFGARTIHSMIYKIEDSRVTYEPRFTLDYDSDVRGAALVIIDEVSMVNEDLGRDLLSFGTPVLVLGDPAQLPPVKGEGFFTEAEPDVMLTEVHRQAKDSPIIQMATTIREGGRLEFGKYGESSVIARADICAADVLAADQVIVGRNATRVTYNRRIRELKKIEGIFPSIGEKVICLRNDRNKKLLNGSLWTVAETKNRSKRDRDSNLTRLTVRAEEAAPEDKGLAPKDRDADKKWRDHYIALQALDHDGLIDELCRLASKLIDLTCPKYDSARGSDWKTSRQAIINTLTDAMDAESVRSSIASRFDPEVFFTSVAGAYIDAAVIEMGYPPPKGKKPEKVAAAAARARETGWLPAQLRTPHYVGPGADAGGDA